MSRNEDFDDGDVVIDASGNVAQKGFTGNGGWWVLGWVDEEHPFDSLTQPVRRLVPAAEPVKGRGDPHLYRITYANGSVKHGRRNVLGPAAGRTNTGAPNYRRGRIVKVERLPEPPEWVDVTSEFIRS